MESWNRDVFARHGLDYDFMQDNHAYSQSAGVMRGFHFQAPPAAQTKLVWVVRGAVLDAALDLRRGSPTYGRGVQLRMTASNFRRLLIPKGMAHAYMTLEPDTEVFYKVDAPYSPAREGGILWNDPGIGLEWPVPDPIISEKDSRLPRLKDFESPFTFSCPLPSA